MTIVYICSDDRRAGKTALALALGLRLAREGFSVGYWKPVSEAGPEDGDVVFAKQVLRLAEHATVLAPLALTGERVAAQPKTAWRERLTTSLAAVAKGKDCLLVEGSEHLTVEGDRGPGADAIVDLLSGGAAPLARSADDSGGGVKALYLARYRDGDIVARIARDRQTLGAAFAGAFVNGLPEAHRWFVEEQVVPGLASRGIKLLGALPQDPPLATVTARELAAYLGASVLVNESEPAMDELFESVMFGSMSAEDGHRYFSRKQNKLVVTRGDRPDVHLAALGTSTCCLLLTGGYPSYPFVLDRAEELGVPVLSVTASVQDTIGRLDELLTATRAHSPAKLARFDRLVEEHLGWAPLREALGLVRKAMAGKE